MLVRIIRTSSKVVIAALDGQLTVKVFRLRKDGVHLLAANEEFKPIHVSGDTELEIWGVVTFVIHKV